ncbi:pentatricopeptide repeat-containing protein At3g09040, mitochondrial-like [Mangifera indica]|uniref:pentatricopeptide repeat-containing protein At3g09040, mitochondrial-like n=1 Tax=Mangifera indica TaxID=29780 RepID=UPI001CFA07AB|nr:pentatricopeptide repeat-containing protein At3g09040, mitochondrial-like [Mangifera indica]
MKALARSLSPQKPCIKELVAQDHLPQALKYSLSVFSSPLTDQIYSLFIKKGHSLDPFLSSFLISHFTKLGDFNRSFSFLCDTQNPDIVTYNALISGLARFNQPGPVFKLFNWLRREDLRPDVFTLSSLVKACENFEHNKIAHSVSLKLGFSSGAFLVSGLVENYARCGDIVSAQKCFRECLELDNVAYTAMVCGYVWNEEFEKSKEVFMEMRGLGLELNEFSLTSVIGASFCVEEGEQIHGLSVKLGLFCGSYNHLNNAMMNMYVRFGEKMEAIKVFDEIAEPDVVSWTERIGASSGCVEAFELFKAVFHKDFEINQYTMINVLSVLANERMLKPARQIQAFCYKVGFLEVISVVNSLIFMYMKCGQIHDARRVFDDTSCRDLVTWNSLIAGYSENGFTSQALEMFCHMCDCSLQPNNYTLASVLDAVSNSKSVKQVMQIQSHVIKSGFMMDEFLVSCLITTYGKCEGINESKRIFFETDMKIVVHVNALATALVYVGCHSDALEFFRSIWGSCPQVDSSTFSIVLKACGAITDLEWGRAIHSLDVKTGFDQDSFVESAVIDMYCKCGNLEDAEKAFRNISTQNLAAWNAMMMGYAQHGHHQDVSNLFNSLSEFGVKPDKISYLAVLTSCCHAGLVREAHSYIDHMLELHGVIPQLEHYACLVDLLGRVGLLEDAKKTIDQMPIPPDAHIWQILLSACNIDGNIDLGRVAASKLLELQPDNESAYILLSKLYASAGMWNAVGNLRKEMKDKFIHKEPGSSWIQVGGSTHYFFAVDTLHSQSKEIYKELIKLYEHMLELPKWETCSFLNVF